MSVDTPARRTLKKRPEDSPVTPEEANKMAADAASATGALSSWIAAEMGKLQRSHAEDAQRLKVWSGVRRHFSALIKQLMLFQAQVLEAGIPPRETGDPLIALRYHQARRAFSSDSELADLIRVNRSQVLRWKQGKVPDSENYARLVALETVVSLLDGFLEPTTMRKWFRGINAHLGDRTPIDVLREGRLSEVVRAIEAERSGAFA